MRQLENSHSYFRKRKSLLHRFGAFMTLAVILALVMTMLASGSLYAQVAPDPFACYGIADEYNGDPATDGLALINRLDGSAQVIGPTGTAGIEALAFAPVDVNGSVQQVMFATADPTNPDPTSSNTLGTVDLATGTWSAIGGPIGSGTDASGTVFDFSTAGDIDGLTYDVQRDILWATQRNSGDGNPDYLLQLDPATGQIVPDAFGAGIDWVAVPLATDPAFQTIDGIAYDDIDDLAVDPVSGRVYIINNKGGTGGGLVELDPNTGAVLTYIGLFTGNTSADGIVDDMEGLAFFNDGQLYGSTGNNGPDPDDLNKLFVVDIATGATTFIGDFPVETKDIEALGCLTAPAFITLEKATNGVDADQPTGPNIPVGGAVAWTYVIENTGALPLIGMTLNDDILGDISNSCAEGALPNPFAAGDTFTCTVSGTADMMGQYANVATVDATFETPGPDGMVTIPLSAEDPSHYYGLSVGISIVKTAGDAADGDTYMAPGPGIVLFTYVVENTGNTHLIDITIVDDAGTPTDTSDDVTISDVTCPDLAGPLAPAGTVTCTAEIQVNANATNNAVVTGIPSDPDGNPYPDVEPPTAEDPADVTVPLPEISIVKTAGDAADGETYTIGQPGIVTFYYEVTNTGSTYLSDITITDDAGTADAADDVTITSAECAGLAGPLAPDGSVSCSADIQVNGDVTNVATTTGNPTDENGNDLPGVDDPTDDDPADVVYAPGTPAIQIIKTAGNAADGDVLTIGAPMLVTFNYEVTNTGDTYLSDITITDDAGTAGDASDDVTITSAECADLAGPLAMGASVNCSAEIQVNGDATNVAMTTGNPTDENGNDLPGVDDPTDDDPADVVYAPGTPGIAIVKTAGDAADGDVYEADMAGPVTFTYVVQNTGGTHLTDITITDDAGTAADTSDDVTITSAECAGLAGPLAPGDEVTCTADIVVNGDAVNNAATIGTPTDENGNPLPDVDSPTAADDAEVILLGSIGDTVWMDLNGDGVQDADEIGIPAVTVILTMPDGSTVSTVTDADGMYLFPDLPAGDYMVTIDVDTLPPGVLQTFDADGVMTSNTSSLTLAPDEDNLDQDFGYVVLEPGIQLEKTVYLGHDDGAQCSGNELERGANTPITYCFNVTNTGETHLIDIELNDNDLGITDSDMTLLSGSEPLAPGAAMMFYYETVLTEDLLNTADVTGTPSDASGNPIPGLPRPVDEDIANVETVASLGDYVWFDRDADGSQESSEAGLEGVTVHLIDEDGEIISTTTTDADGFYLFDNLLPGDYAIRVETPVEGYIISPMDNFDDAFDSDISPENGQSAYTTLETGENERQLDAGFTAPPQLRIEKSARENSTLPGGTIVYELAYMNEGVGDAAGVVVTEVVPRDSTFVPEASTPGWECEEGLTLAGTICKFEIGFVPAGSIDNGVLLFVVNANTDMEQEVTLINNQVIIGDDGTNGPQLEGQTVDSYTVEVQRPTSIDVDFEPGIGSGGNERIFLPFVGRRLRSDGTPYQLSVDQRVMSLICEFMDGFGWTSDACFIDPE